MQIGFRVNFKEELDIYSPILADIGYNGLEISAPYQRDLEYTEAVKRITNRYGFSVSVHANYGDEANFASYSAKIREIAIKTLYMDIDFARAVGARVLTLHPGSMADASPLQPDHPFYERALQAKNSFRQEALKHLAESLVILDRYANEMGIQLALENMGLAGHTLKTKDDFHHLFENKSLSNICITLDFGHGLIAGMDISDFIKSLRGRIIHTHIHWNDGKYDLHLPIQPGYLGIPMDFDRISRSIKDLIRYCPECPLVFEMIPRQPEEYIACKASLDTILL